MSPFAARPAWADDPVARLEHKNSFDASLIYGVEAFNRATGRSEPTPPPFMDRLDPATGLIKRDLTVPRVCPVCGAATGELLFVKNGFSHVLCLDCQLIYVDWVLRPEMQEEYWQREAPWNAVLQSGPQVALDREKYAYGLDMAASWAPGPQVLDVGTGPGLFLNVAREKGWQPTGLELNLENQESLSGQGFELITRPLTQARLMNNNFDLITFWEVLEHLADPQTALTEARKFLSPGGVVLILVPNVHSLVTRLLHEKSGTFGGHSHLNHFSAVTLKRLLDQSGLRILEMETVISELGAINNYLAFAPPYEGPGQTIWPDLTPGPLHERLLGSRLLVWAVSK